MERSPDFGTDDITINPTNGGGMADMTPDPGRARGSDQFTGEIDTDFGTGTAAEPQMARSRGVRELAADAKDRVASQVSESVHSQQARAGETLSAIARSLRSSSDQLHEQQQDTASRFIEQAASKLDEFANGIQNANLSELADRTEAFARRRPAVFIGAAFLAGVVAARFLKSSRRKLEENQPASGPALERAPAFRASDVQVTTPIVAESSRPSSDATGATWTRETP